MKRLCDVVHISATTANVFSGRISERAPAWARIARVQVIHSDGDHQHSLTLGGQEVARNSAPNIVAAITALASDWESSHCQVDLTPGSNAEALLSITETTAGEGLAVIEYLDRLP